ncbi:RelA/SpoT protein [Pasteurella multocida]|uniref:RelA/SpoT protein n=1 Tax=Pasteurella multocida TaxID=747 RepID=UPI00147B8B03|nr:RelA/SpoT protein [Pasteurella multocida]NNI76169.1 RelA/SpoT protein [Pasteurella multocida]
MNSKSLKAIKDEIENKITESLNNFGIMFRVFTRIKGIDSLNKKIDSNEKYRKQEKKIQDILGIRIVLYFPDDIKIVHKIISRLYIENSKDASIDEPSGEIFKPIRYNLIYNLPNETYFGSIYQDIKAYIDLTFEIQIRTVLSEGWHEVEHDLRYKFKEDWDSSPEEYRKLNGVYASLETNEWTMLQILHSVSYKHYKNRNWDAMFRQHFRMRMTNYYLSEEIKKIFNENPEIAKSLFKLDRSTLIEKMYEKYYSEPLTIDNIIYFANAAFIKNDKIKNITPVPFFEDFAN